MQERTGYEKLNIYVKAHRLAVEIHKMTLSLPKFEMFEEGSQIRRSSKSASSNIVEGYSLRNYKADYIHSLYRSYTECEETGEHLKFLYETDSLKDKELFEYFYKEYDELGKMIFSFINSVEKGHKSKK